MRNRKLIPLIVYALVMILAFSWASGMFGDGTDDIPYSEIVKMIHAEQVTLDQIAQKYVEVPMGRKLDALLLLLHALCAVGRQCK